MPWFTVSCLDFISSIWPILKAKTGYGGFMKRLLCATSILLILFSSASQAQEEKRSRAIPPSASDSVSRIPVLVSPRGEAPRLAEEEILGDDVTDEEVEAATKPPVKAASSALGAVTANSVGVKPGEILIVTSKHRLYLGLTDGKMKSYPVAVGHRGAQWSGSAIIGMKVKNPTWRPTANQRKKKKLPAVVKPGPANPLGIRALYLFQNGRDTLYRIHGTNQPSSIGKSVSSGCIRMRNADVSDLYERVGNGTRVTVR